MPGNPLVRFDEGRVGPPQGVALSPTLPWESFCSRESDKVSGRRPI